jgi:hypothetical protein
MHMSYFDQIHPLYYYFLCLRPHNPCKLSTTTHHWCSLVSDHMKIEISNWVAHSGSLKDGAEVVTKVATIMVS